MQNKANFRKSQVNANTFTQMAYENKSDWTLGENKPNTKPIQSQTKPIAERVKLMQSVCLQRNMKKNADRGYEKTKPKQTQFKAKQSQFRNPTAGRQNVLHNKVHTAFIVRKAKVVQKTVVLVERPMAIGYKIAKVKGECSTQYDIRDTQYEIRETRYDSVSNSNNRFG